MKNLQTGAERRAHKQHGLTLVELMISLVISVVIALAAATAYLGTRNTATALSNISNLNETGNLSLEMVGRELQMAGFYPAILSANNLLGRYNNIKGGATAYNQGLFGCEGARFNPVTSACDAVVAGAPDSVVVNYFVASELDPALFGSGFDCLRQAVSNDPANAGRAPALPLFVSNRYGLSDIQTYTVQGAGSTTRTVSSRSFACNGNGKATEDLVYEPFYEGVVDLVFRYGAHDGTGSLSPSTYRTATEISALPVVGGLTGWQRVTSVRVCVLTRSPDNIRTEDKAGELRSYTDCRDAVNTYLATDRTLFKRFERVFAIRNNLNGVY